MAAFWILLGAVVGFGGKHLLDLQLAKTTRLRGGKLKWSVEFLAAAGRLAQAVAAWCHWQQEMRDDPVADPVDRTVDDRERVARRSVERRERVQYARVDAYRGRSTVRLLVPETDYLELRPREPLGRADEGEKLEDALRKQIGA